LLPLKWEASPDRAGSSHIVGLLLKLLGGGARFFHHGDVYLADAVALLAGYPSNLGDDVIHCLSRALHQFRVVSYPALGLFVEGFYLVRGLAAAAYFKQYVFHAQDKAVERRGNLGDFGVAFFG